MAEQPTNVMELAPEGQTMRDTLAPTAPVALPDGTVLVPESKPATIQDAIKAARDKALAPAAEATTPETPAAPDGEGDADAEGETPDGGDAEDVVDDTLIVELPPRTPNGEAIRIAVPDQESLEAIQRLQNGYMRGEQARGAVAESRQTIEEFEEFRESLQLDPVSVIESAMSVEHAELLVRSLLTHPAILPRLQADLDLITQGDPDALERVRERAKAQRLELKDAAREQIEGQREIRQNARDVNAQIGRLIPEHFTEEQREFFFRDARYDIQEWQQRNRSQLVPPKMVAQLLAPRLKLYGVESAPRREPTGREPSTPRATPGAAPAPSAAVAPSPSPRTVERVKANADKRQLVAAAAPGSNAVGRPNPLSGIPKDADVKGAIAALRKIRRVG